MSVFQPAGMRKEEGGCATFLLRPGPREAHITLFSSLWPVPSPKDTQLLWSFFGVALRSAKKLPREQEDGHQSKTSNCWFSYDVLDLQCSLGDCHLGKWLSCLLFHIHPWDHHRMKRQGDPAITLPTGTASPFICFTCLTSALDTV